MTHLRKIMLEELQRRNYSETMIRHYIRWVEDFARFFNRPPDQLGLEHLRTYQAYLLRITALEKGRLGFMVSHPFAEKREWMGHPEFVAG